mgnify:CR=1 FL=1
MASKTYKMRGLVLKKTKLGEKDLIVSMLDESGMLVQGVAKGARKPGGSFAARLELFSEVDVLMAQGRSLDVVCEARLTQPSRSRSWTLEQSACAAPLAELLGQVAQPDLRQSRVYAISQSAFDYMGDDALQPSAWVAICAASLWKVMEQVGYRPSFTSCVSCGAGVELADDVRSVALSVGEGGLVCGDCRRPADAIVVDSSVVRWCEALIYLRFSEIADMAVDLEAIVETLQIARMWARVHVGRDLKALDFLFSAGIIL